jgi:hypothetical protein
VRRDSCEEGAITAPLLPQTPSVRGLPWLINAYIIAEKASEYKASPAVIVQLLGAILSVLGLSYGATSLAVEALDVYMTKTSVHETVQAAAE